VNADKLLEAMEIEFENIMDDVEVENIRNVENIANVADILETWIQNSSRISETKYSKK